MQKASESGEFSKMAAINFHEIYFRAISTSQPHRNMNCPSKVMFWSSKDSMDLFSNALFYSLPPKKCKINVISGKTRIFVIILT